MIRFGDLWIADLNAETRMTVLVVSAETMHRLTDTVIVVPPQSRAITPWDVDVDGQIFSANTPIGLPASRLLEHVGRPSASSVHAVRVALRRALG